MTRPNAGRTFRSREADDLTGIGVEQDQIAVGDRSAGASRADDRGDTSLTCLRRDVVEDAAGFDDQTGGGQERQLCRQ